MPYRRMNNRRRKLPRKKAIRNKYQPKKRNIAFSGKARLTNRVELLRPINLKPRSQLKKVIFYNTAEVVNAMIGTSQFCQFNTFYLNSIWMQANDTYATGGGNTWNWNTVMAPHTNGTSILTGTSYPGLFGTNQIGTQYQDICVVGAKFTISASPIQSNSACGPTALFASIESQGSDLTSASTITDLYNRPFTTVRKISGNQGGSAGGLNGWSNGNKIVITYSPKRHNNVANIRDNAEFFAHTSSAGTAANGNKPSELDRLSFGICSTLTNSASPLKCCPVQLQVKCEATILFNEPYNDLNQYPGLPAEL